MIKAKKEQIVKAMAEKYASRSDTTAAEIDAEVISILKEKEH